MCGVHCCHKSYLLRSTTICLCSLLHVNPVRSRFRHIHVVHGLSNPLAKLSSMLTVALSGIACSLLSHALHRLTLGGKSAGFTLRKKQFLLCCCLPAPMTLASGGSPMFPLVVHQPASPSIWPAVQSLRRGLSTNPGATMWYVCGCS